MLPFEQRLRRTALGQDFRMLGRFPRGCFVAEAPPLWQAREAVEFGRGPFPVDVGSEVLEELDRAVGLLVSVIRSTIRFLDEYPDLVSSQMRKAFATLDSLAVSFNWHLLSLHPYILSSNVFVRLGQRPTIIGTCGAFQGRFVADACGRAAVVRVGDTTCTEAYSIALWWVHPGAAKYHSWEVQKLILDTFEDLPSAMNALGANEERLGLLDLKECLRSYEASPEYVSLRKRYVELAEKLGRDIVKGDGSGREDPDGIPPLRVEQGQEVGRADMEGAKNSSLGRKNLTRGKRPRMSVEAGEAAVAVVSASSTAVVSTLDPDVYRHFKAPRALTNALSTVSKARKQRPDFDLLSLAERRVLLQEIEQTEGRRLRIAQLDMLKREGRFVAELGETMDEQLARSGRSRARDLWNVRKSPSQLFVRCLLCGLLCCKQPTTDGQDEIKHHAMSPPCIAMMQKGWHWVPQLSEVEGAKEEDRLPEPESLYLQWLKEEVAKMVGAKVTLTQWEGLTRFIAFAKRVGPAAKITYDTLSASVASGSQGTYPFPQFAFVMNKLIERAAIGGMELPCRLMAEQVETTAAEARRWNQYLAKSDVARQGPAKRTIRTGCKRWDFTLIN
ncbi:hypothetical protein HK101_006258 [Irineochytrium annulatum]|nr:hypothetical protein HK101_006258 [Irineochytrium annulatum]